MSAEFINYYMRPSTYLLIYLIILGFRIIVRDKNVMYLVTYSKSLILFCTQIQPEIIRKKMLMRWILIFLCWCFATQHLSDGLVLVLQRGE